MSHGKKRPAVGASLQTIADETGLSKSSVQNALRRLKHRQLVTAKLAAPTATPVYEVHQPSRRDAG